MLLAQDSGLNPSEWKEELYHKLNPDMKRALINESNDQGLMYEGFVTRCTMTSNRLEQIAKEERSQQRVGGDDKKQSSSGGDSKPAGKQPRAAFDTERAKLYEAGLCFNCKQPGHQGRDCPLRKKKVPDLKELESTEDSEKVKEAA